MKQNYIFKSEEDALAIVKNEIGLIFVKVLEYAGVYKKDENGLNAFKKLVNKLCSIK